MEAQILIVEDIAESGHVRRVDRHSRIEIDGVYAFFARRVEHRACSKGDGIQAVFPLKRFVEPCHVLLQFRHDLFYAPLVRGFMIEIEFRPSKKRHTRALGIRFRQDGFSGFRVVSPADRAVFFLLVVKVIDILTRVEIAVRIYEKKRRENRFELIDDTLSAFGI